MPARPLRRFEPALIAVGFALTAPVGCSNSSATTPGVTHPTMIEIAPEQFSGDVPCAADGAQPGLKSYVATLIDPNADDDGTGGASGDDAAVGGAASGDDFALPSSPPTSCLAGVGFGFIVPGRHYVARIQGFDQAGVVARAPGSALVVDADGKPVAPTWTADCDATLAVEETIVRPTRCTSFLPSDANAEGSLYVRFAPLLGGLACGSGTGEVDHLTLSLEIEAIKDEDGMVVEDSVARVQTLSCDEMEAVFADLPSRRSASITVEAFSAGSLEPLAGATCNARALPAASIVAQCTALNQEGTLRVDLPAALELLGLECDDVSDVRVQALGADDSQSFPPPACHDAIDEGFAAGNAAVTVTVVRGDETSSVTCHGQVAPGGVTVADCELP